MKAAFIEQDGVIYPHIISKIAYTDIKFYDDVPLMLNMLSARRYLLAFVNNWRFEKGKPIYRMLGNKIQQKLAKLISGPRVFQGCFHSEDEDCECRMPKPLMLDRIIKGYALDVKQCIFFAGSAEGIEAAHKAGIGKICIIKTGLKWYREKDFPIERADTLTEAITAFLSELEHAAVAG